MANFRRGTYIDGQSEIECRVKKSGKKTTRIVFGDGTEKLVPTSSMKVEAGVTNNDAPERLVPTVPLELFYRPLRKLTGTKKEKCQSLLNSLNERHGPKGSDFLVELFRRSVQHAERYSNVGERFYDNRKGRVASKYPFAKSLVKTLRSGTSIQAGSLALGFVDYEIFPFRTTKSCCETGKPATSIGSGGMDLLLASTMNGVIVPAMGEIKAATETVGPTFALIQSLMYTSQLLTCNQFRRLKKHYSDPFAAIDEQRPKMDVIVLLEVDRKLDQEDLKYALSLAADMQERLSDYLRQVVFMSCSIRDHAVKCDVVTID